MRHHVDASPSTEDNSAATTTDNLFEVRSPEEESHSLNTENADLKALGRQLKSSLAQSKSEVRHLKTCLQRLDPSLLSQTQIYMYTSLGQVEFKCLVAWLSTLSVGKRLASPCPAFLHSGESVLTFS